jgi:DNA-binding response OmpR family regulator
MTPSVLIVDDDAEFRRLVRRLLAGSGFDVLNEAASVAGGRLAAVELRPEAALVDVGLPDGNGIQLARELARLEWSPRIILTSSDAAFAAELDDGEIPFIAKENLPTAPLLELMEAR